MSPVGGHGASFAVDCVTLGRLVEAKLRSLRYPIHYREEFRTPDGRRVAVAFGTSSPFGASTLVSLAMESARYVPFLIRIEENSPGETAVRIWGAGAQGILGLDYGRNEGVARRILDGIPATQELADRSLEEIVQGDDS